MSNHDLTLLALGGTCGAYLLLLAYLLTSLWDDRRTQD